MWVQDSYIYIPWALRPDLWYLECWRAEYMKAAVSPHAQVSQDKSKMMGLRPKTKFVSPIPPTPFSSKCNVKIEDRNDLNILFPTPFSKVLKYNVNVFF